MRVISYIIVVVVLLSNAVGLGACAPRAKPSADTVATLVAQSASELLTLTAAAASPTPPSPTITLTPSATASPTSTPTSNVGSRRPQTLNFASCGLGGPEPNYAHETNIAKGKAVELLGIGSIDGWYVIRDPYFHRPCWIAATDLKIFPGTDLSTYPVMTPGVPPMGQ